VSKEEAIRGLCQSAIIALAGKIAEVHARRPDKDGWVRLITPERSLALHEAAHAVVAASLARYVLRLSIVPNEKCRSRSGRYIQAGHCLHSSEPEIELGPPEESVLVPDHSRVALAALALTLAYCPDEMPSWMAARRIIRVLRQATSAIVVQNWILINSLGSQLERDKQIDRVAVERFTNRVPPACVDLSSFGLTQCESGKAAASKTGAAA
jgi:hypothetical protein